MSSAFLFQACLGFGGSAARPQEAPESFAGPRDSDQSRRPARQDADGADGGHQRGGVRVPCRAPGPPGDPHPGE